MNRRVVILAVLSAAASLPAEVQRRGSADSPTANHFRVSLRDAAPQGTPIAFDLVLPDDFNPDSARVMPDGGTRVLPVKVEWRRPRARVSYLSTGAAAYWFYFDEGLRGYLFTNLGTNARPIYDRAEWLGPGQRELTAADFDGDARIDLVTSGGYFSDFRQNRMARFVEVKLDRNYFVGRDDMWQPFDWDGDGRIDLLVGVSDWRDYGWDDAHDEKGRWTRGPLHGYVYLHRNRGASSKPAYETPVRIEAGGKPIDLYGSPAPNPVDWFGRGVFDLIGGSFVDSITLFRNKGTRERPELAAGELLQAAGQPLRMELCMIQPRVVSWHEDGRPSLLVAEDDGTVSLVENTAPRGSAPRLAAPRRLEQVDPYLKTGVLSRPAAVDWNGDGKLDLLAGNSAGYIRFFENTGTVEAPAFTDRGNLTAEGSVIRRVAGPNGSVQGPAEEKWGYSNPSVADWDLDGDLDILVNDIWGSVIWHRNIGSETRPQLAKAERVEVEWRGRALKPEWTWWEPVSEARSPQVRAPTGETGS